MAESKLKQIGDFSFDPYAAPLGRGASGTVFKATHTKTNEPAAVKIIHTSRFRKSEESIERGIGMLGQIKGDHVVKLLDVQRTPNNLYIFTEYCDGGDLESKMRSKMCSRHEFAEEEVLSIIHQIAYAFVTLEQLPTTNLAGDKVTFMHGNISGAKILFHQGKVKVADWGFFKSVEGINPFLEDRGYMSPEWLNSEAYGVKSDVWSTGVLLYQLLFGVRCRPWLGALPSHLYRNIMRKPLCFPKEVSKSIQDLLTMMLKIDEKERISWKEVYEHPAFNTKS